MIYRKLLTVSIKNPVGDQSVSPHLEEVFFHPCEKIVGSMEGSLERDIAGATRVYSQPTFVLLNRSISLNGHCPNGGRNAMVLRTSKTEGF